MRTVTKPLSSKSPVSTLNLCSESKSFPAVSEQVNLTDDVLHASKLLAEVQPQSTKIVTEHVF